MYLTYRSTRPGDFEACFKLMHNRFVFTRTKTEKGLRALWNRTLGEHTAVSLVLEDQDRPTGKKIMGLGFSVFAADGFLEEAKARLPAYPALQALRALKRGQKPFLSLPEIARQNAGEGLNVLTLFYGWEKRVPEAEQGKLRLKLMEAFQWAHQGWRLKEFLQEVYGPQSKADMEGIGMTLRRDYRESLPQPRAPVSSRPYLFGIRRGERPFLEGNYLFAQFFNYTPPRFHFSAGEKEVLLRALEGEIDSEIAGSLHLSRWTIKKRWQGLYRKVEHRDSTLLKPDRTPGDHSQETPDLRRRRRLLGYLRHHMEEIRPLASPRRG
jgi:DNA-binding CsgD family transcriptional regulator